MTTGEGSDLATLDDFLEEGGIREEVALCPVKSLIALQLQQAMKAQGMTPAAMAAEMEVSRAQLNQVLDPNASNVTLDTLSRTARVLGSGPTGSGRSPIRLTYNRHSLPRGENPNT